jgi:pimeloyl-[acyl-carrier protein] methyl ester esterase
MDMRTRDVHVEAVGRGSPLVLLHGWGLHGGVFAPLLPQLARHRRVFVVDLPGHGRSGPLRPWTVDGAVRALDAALVDVDGGLDVLGWSLGGLLALAWARMQPRRIGRLVLVATTPRFAAAPDWPHAMSRETLGRFADELAVAYRATLLRFLTLQVQGSERGRATLASLRHELVARGEPDAGALRDALDTLAAADVRGDVGAIARPALVIAGDRDTLVPHAACAWLAGAMREARLVTIHGAAHAPFLSHPDAFAAALDGFLDG